MLLLVVSEEIYRTVVRHGYGGIDRQAFRRLVRVQIAGNRYPGWIHAPDRQARTMPLTWPVSISATNGGPTGAAPRGLETLVPPPRETLAPQPAGMSG